MDVTSNLEQADHLKWLTFMDDDAAARSESAVSYREGRIPGPATSEFVAFDTAKASLKDKSPGTSRLA